MDHKHKVVRVSTKKEGEHFVIQVGNKAPYTQSFPECSAVKLRGKDTVVDIGAYVGEYALRCARFPVRRVFAYEPTPATFDVLHRNLKNLPERQALQGAVAIQAAVVPDSSTRSVWLYLSRGNGTRNRLAPIRGTSAVEVPAVPYAKAVKGATVVKIDVEGAEWDYPIATHLAAPLRGLIIEFHPRKEQHREGARLLIAQIEAAGFRRVYPESERSFWNRFKKHGPQWGAHRAWVHDER